MIPEAQCAGSRGAVYSLMAMAFRDPDSKSRRALADPAKWCHWPEALHRIDPDAAKCLGDLRSCLHKSDIALENDHDRELGSLQDAFVELFGHTVRAKCPPYELEYGRGEIGQRASDLADIAGFYSAFGMAISGEAEDRPDHVSIECEFMNVLCAKEAHALETGEAELLHSVRKAQLDFVRDHLARWLPAFSHRVGEAAAHEFYGALAEFAAAFMAGECRRLGVDAGPRLMELGPANPDLDASIDCGGPTACAPGSGQEFTPLNIETPRTEGGQSGS